MSTEEETTPVAAEGVAAPAEDGGGAESAPVVEEESTATFEPVVKLEEVEVASGEEEEEAIYTQRSKLYIYGETMLDKGTGNKTWIERGVGNFRIMRHLQHDKLRVLMRQDKTLKIICNHVIDPRIQLVPHVQSDRALIWVAFDFSDGGTELVETTFCLKFGDSDLAQQFKNTFQECQSKMEKLMGMATASTEEEEEKAKTKDPETEKATEEAADQLAELSTKDE